MDAPVGFEPTSPGLGGRDLSSSGAMAVSGGHEPQGLNPVALSRRTPHLAGSLTVADTERIELPPP